MKKISLIIFVLFLITLSFSCSKKEDEQKPDSGHRSKNGIELLAEQAGIPNDIQLTGALEEGKSTFISGRKGNTFYFYKIEDRKIIVQHQEAIPNAVEIEGRTIEVSKVKSNIMKHKDGSIFAWIGDVNFPDGYYVKLFVFHDNKFKEIEKKTLLFDIRKREGEGYLIRKERTLYEKGFLYDNDWNLLGYMENSLTKNAVEYITLKGDRKVTLLKIQGNKIEQYIKELPFDNKDVEAELMNTNDKLINIRFVQKGYSLIFVDGHLFEENETGSNHRTFTDITYITQKTERELLLYKIENSKIIKEYKVNIPESISIDKGFGETEYIKTNQLLWNIVKSNNNIFLMAFKENKDPYAQNRYYYLIYLFNQETLKKIDFKNRLLRIENIEIWGEFGFKIHTEIAINGRELSRYFFYDNNWELLYASETELKLVNNLDSDDPSFSKYYFLLNSEEIIYFYRDSFSRINLKDNIKKWELSSNSVKSFNSFPKNTRLDNLSVSKNGNVWTFMQNYTLLNGEKGIKSIKINIETGEVVN
ncbi:hypothetical protein [Capnocytophaga leadbetteri]